VQEDYIAGVLVVDLGVVQVLHGNVSVAIRHVIVVLLLAVVSLRGKRYHSTGHSIQYFGLQLLLSIQTIF